jgi:membrane protein DedA with SNARE-associated domain
MDDLRGFLAEHGGTVVFLTVLVAQLGAPIPAELLLLAAGALTRSGELHFAALLALTMTATLFAQTAWYEAGRARGERILALVCRVTLEPDVCVRKTSDLFTRFGAKALVAAYFVPGLSVIAAPLAGTSRMPRSRFHLFNLVGALLWCGGFLGLGFVLRRQVESVLALVERVGGGLLEVGGGAVVLYVGWRLLQRWRILRELRMARIDADELERLLEGAATLVVVDLRHPLEFDADPRLIPGALRILPEELAARHAEIPRDRDVVLYCT